MKKCILYLLLILSMAGCVSKNPHINQAWNVKYPKNVEKEFASGLTLKKSDPLKKLETSPEFFLVNGDDTTITGKRGTIIQINRYCLVTESGDFVEGPIKVELRETFSKSDLILNNKPTVSDKKMLVSAGAIYLNATCNGKNLIINCQEGLRVSIPKQSFYPGMQIFNGVLNEEGDINWIAEETKESVNEEEPVYFEEDVIEEDYNPEIINYVEEGWEEDTYFNFSAGKFGWINCDAFYEDNRPKTNLVVKVSNPLPEDFKSRMFLVFKNLNSVLPVYATAPDLFQSPEVPEGEEVYLVCISGNEKVLFSEIRSLDIRKGQIETVSLSETSEVVLKERISRL